jgi:soluble lytic murein transglycosylase
MLLIPFLLAATTAHADPCALRALVDKAGADLAALTDRISDKPDDARLKACMNVVTANALSREGHGSDAVARFDAAAPALPELASFLELAKKRALARPAGPGKETPPATADEAAERVMRLVREAKPRKAVDVALAFPRKDGPPHEALEVATITALVRAERIDEALARAEKLPTADAFAKARAWALSKAQRFGEARDAYAALASSTTDAALRAEASFYAGFSAYESDDLDDAKARFRASLDVVKGSPFEAFTRWYLAFSSILEGKWAEALPVLEALVADLPSDREALKHRYWLDRARLEAGDAPEKKRAKDDLAAMAVNDATDWYGMLARQRIGKKPWAGHVVPPDAVARLARDDDDAKLALLLWNLGLDDEARTVARKGEDIAAVGVQHLVGDFTFGWRRGGRFIPRPMIRGGRIADDPKWRVSYASPWKDVVDAAAKKYGVPASFVYAIMRTESGFDPRAVSIAGAQGVIQLLPSSARGACGLAGRPVSDAARIFDPTVAIDLGAALLGKHKEELGSLMLAAAAYNGAPPNVAAWMKRYRRLELEMFVERIPFRETRDYVKRVLAVEATYRALDGGKLALDLPSSIPEPRETLTSFPMDE